MKKLISAIHIEWQKAKEKAQALCIEHNDYSMARKLEECQMFKGTETLEDLIHLMFTPKGIEFLITYSFPSLEIFRKFKGYHPEKFGMFIDCGNIEISDNQRVFLVGNTTAKINYRETAGNRLYLMHGAKASVIASGYSVTRIEKDESSQVQYILQDNAKVL